MGATSLTERIRAFRWSRQGLDGGLTKASRRQERLAALRKL